MYAVEVTPCSRSFPCQLLSKCQHCFPVQHVDLSVMQLSHGLVGGEKDKFYEDLEVRGHRVPRGQNVGGGAQAQRCPSSVFRLASFCPAGLIRNIAVVTLDFDFHPHICLAGPCAGGASQVFAIRDSRESTSGKGVPARELDTGPRERCQGEQRRSCASFRRPRRLEPILVAGVLNRPRRRVCPLAFRCSRNRQDAYVLRAGR